MNVYKRKEEKGENRPKGIKRGQMGKLLVEGSAGIGSSKPPLMERIKNMFILPKEKEPKEMKMLNYMFGRAEVSMAQHLIENGASIIVHSYSFDTHAYELKKREIPDLHSKIRVEVGSKKADENMGFMVIDGDNLEANLACKSLYRVSENNVSPVLAGVLNLHRGKIGSFYKSTSHNVNFVIEITKDGKVSEMLRKAPYNDYKKEMIGKVEAIEKALEAGDMEKVRKLLEAEKPKPKQYSEPWYGNPHGIGIMGPNDREV